MRSPFRRRCPFLIALGIAALLAIVPTAAAAPSAPDVDADTGRFTNGGGATFGWSGSRADETFQIVRFEGGLEGEPDQDFGMGRTAARGFPGPGSYTFRVQAVQASTLIPGLEQEGPYGTFTVTVDRTPPTIAVGLSPGSPNGDNGWYTSLVVRWACDDAGGAGVASCPGDENVGAQGAGQRRTGAARDRAGNVSGTIASPAFNFDGASPSTGPMRSPSPGAVVASEPTFVWGSAPGGETSGFNRYEIMVRIGGTYRAVARVPHRAGVAQYSATRDPRLWSQALPRDTDLRWFVRTYDNAGNAGGGLTQARNFRIDSTVPGPPAISGGPSGPTNISGPTFTWTGAGPSFAWEVSVSGTESIVRSGSGPQRQASVTPLPDGDYTFAVSQVTAAGGRGAEAVRSFEVDTAAPPAPVITGRPPFPTNDATPSFSWTTDPGSSSRWKVLAAGGATLQNSDTPLTSVTLNPLGSGAYNFRVVQVDAAGNESAAALEPFSITGVGPPSSARRRMILPTQNATRLRPRAGKTMLTRRPVLRWAKGPTGTTVYNLQVFRVLKTRTAGRTPSVKKIYSVFPAKRRYEMPSVKILPGTCYVWRIWPYVNDRFTSKPLGVSNFCIASRKVLRQKAAADAKRRARAR